MQGAQQHVADLLLRTARNGGMVDLHVRDVEGLQVGKRGDAAAEAVERELKSQRRTLAGEVVDLHEAAGERLLFDFEANVLRRYMRLARGRGDELRKLRIRERGLRQIEKPAADSRVLALMACNPAERMAQAPPVDAVGEGGVEWGD